MFFTKRKFATMSMEDAKKELETDLNIILIDVREPEEYAQRHIPNSKNVPISNIEGISDAVPDKSARIFVYCLSGARSRRACGVFAELGYTDVTNIGGINAW
ncbi:MAG: rhodanese-like domain-containing protein [Oscillospiraceae bacterium]